MNGIPVPIQLDGERVEVYFRTRLVGEAGDEMRQAKADFYAAQNRMAASLQRVVLYGSRADTCTTDAELEQLLEQQEKASRDQLQHKADAEAAATRYLMLSLTANYGEKEAERILGAFTDAQVNQLVKVVEIGELPRDFFPSRGTPPSESITAQSGCEPSKPSSKPGSAAATSMPVTSASKMDSSLSRKKKGKSARTTTPTSASPNTSETKPSGPTPA